VPSFSEFERDSAPQNSLESSDAANGRTVDRAPNEFGAVLEQVLRETLSLAGEMKSRDGAEVEALREVARRRGGEFSVTIAADLVSAVLSLRFGSLLAPSQQEPAARNIAATMMGDPRARRRLERLWEHLCEAVQ
jgi:hypothetical protein